MKKKKIAKIFIVISILFIGSLCGIFGYRLVHYYRLEHPKTEEKKEVTLMGTITDEKQIVTKGNGIYQDDEMYYFKGNVDNNYVSYSGILWRIIRINEDKTITLISEDDLTSMVFGYEIDGFKDSYVYQWLNDTFYKNLYQADNYVIKTSYCVDAVKDDKNINCKKKETSSVGMLSVYEYLRASGSKGYLNNQKYYWTVNPGNEKNIWIINEKGLVTEESLEKGSKPSYGVRPVITIKDTTSFTGKGTKEEPYVFVKNESKILKEQTIGNYVSYSNQVWKIISTDEYGVKVALTSPLVLKEEVSKPYSNRSNVYSIKEKSNIGYYLNSTYYSSLENKEYLVSYPWKVFYYNQEQEYHYMVDTVDTIKTEVGLLSVGDIFINDFSGYALMTATNKEEDTIFTVQEHGKLYADMITEELKVRPAIVLNGALNIVSGSGTEKDPFVLGA